MYNKNIQLFFLQPLERLTYKDIITHIPSCFQGVAKLFGKDVDKVQTIIEELYLGNINPNEKLKPKDPKYEDCVRFALKLETDLLSKINDGEKEIFKKLMENHNSIHTMSVVEAFANGYKIGSLLTMEVLANKEEIYE